ncbi:hypothetical protein [Cytobacillus firmus]|uniref:hypothetical protein n=1 Tax=Cytobacillus firmus TaxID=1399 RepID=UPI0018CF8445|nr:hypothetical protein [Cytobacillus firmus]MED1941899.1 hypothetical protein [Cytobacillus firmus]
MKKLSLTYNPLLIVRHALQRFAEELEGKHTKAVQFARYRHLNTMTDIWKPS